MAGSSSELVYDVQLVAATGREQAVSLRIRRDGLWLYTQGGKVLLVVASFAGSSVVMSCPLLLQQLASRCLQAQPDARSAAACSMRKRDGLLISILGWVLTC